MPDKSLPLSGTLYERTVTLLKADGRSLLDIHKQSGLPFYWLRKLYAGSIPDPGVNRVQALYEYLTEAKLAVK